MTGILYGIGLGPGAPDLLTLRAARLIGQAGVVAYPAPEGGESLARGIAAEVIPAGAREIRIEVPMRPAREPAQAAYDKGAAEIGAALAAGEDVALLCEGDPLFYGSFMYLAARLKEHPIEVVPGITSLSAATAAARLPLVARDERLEVMSAGLPEDELAARIAAADAAAILKLGRHLPKLRRVVERLGLTERTTFAQHVSMDRQVLCPLAEAPDGAAYFSLLLITKGRDPWL
ncbi:precorrin-2 C(20)-methyltransferase [Pseudoroseicyclus tamaricis]|uniref:Precorrin-2 C(20)-methyltransferase n=1 Tax=Pseudoroseicyclus tamaricis TaxID=2705421 RepID=A0A6B2JS82_9RHOB|nr:precorrin-2 C(20)-methyltransferase [Pseudoroseicyclus tamaricis]NDU99438.1 precorrin-2 C(20)-methyltransferase [Pseudoroseicyclus tamaricis]